jgi:hypothetical protein
LCILERAEKNRQDNDRRFTPFGFEDDRIEFHAGKKSQNNGAGSSQKVIHCVLQADPPCANPKSPVRKTPMTSWATVPTTISDNAVDILRQIANSGVANTRPTQSAQRAQVFAMSTNS